MNIEGKKYDEGDKARWDKFVIDQSANGTVLQTKKFLDYHPEGRFIDNSLMFMNGSNIVAVLPGNLVEKEKKVLISHEGSTFGGLIIGKQYCKITYMEAIMESLNKYLKDNNYDEIILKQTSQVFQNSNVELIDYYLFLEGYKSCSEIGYYINFKNYPKDIISSFSASRRRDYRYSLKNDLVFKELSSEEEIRAFYEILCDNYKKFKKKPVHSLEELIDFKMHRMQEETGFYGIYHGTDMIAGSMVFKFGKEVIHTQYLAVLQNKTNLFANDFMYMNIIKTAIENGFRKISFGTSTFENGRVLNRPLALYKEGFGTQPYINRTYRKIL